MTNQPLVLRPYQQNAVTATLDAIDRGVRGPVMQVATGGGKTLILADIARHFRPLGRILALAHREELVGQLAQTFRRHLGCEVGIERANQHCRGDEEVIVASVPTVGRQQGERLARRFNPRDFGLILQDEVHHATGACSTFMGAFQWADYLDEDRKRTGRGPVVVGCSATLRRHDGASIAQAFDEVVCDITMPWLIDQGFLVPINAVAIETGVSIEQVRTRMGDFVPAELEKALNIQERNLLAVEHYRREGEGRQFLAFCVSVAHAHRLAEMYRAQGFRVMAIDGNTSAEERALAIQAYKAGRLHGLTNCSVFAEGTDLPMTAATYMLRPTESPLVYSQQVGRGSRLWSQEAHNADPRNIHWDGSDLGLSPTKQDCLVVDLCDVTSRHSLVHAPSLIGKPYRGGSAAAPPPVRDGASFEPVPIEVFETELILRDVDPWCEKAPRDLDLFCWWSSGDGWNIMLPDGRCRIHRKDQEFTVLWTGTPFQPSVHATQLLAFREVDTLVLEHYGIRPRVPIGSSSDRSLRADAWYCREAERLTEGLRGLFMQGQDKTQTHALCLFGLTVLAEQARILRDQERRQHGRNRVVRSRAKRR